MYPPEAASPSTTTTSGFCSLSRINESCSCSEPDVVPPGVLMCTITARARDFPVPPQRLPPSRIGAEGAGDGDAGDRSARPPDQHVGAGRAQRGAHRDHGADGDDDRADAPEGELAPHAATIDDSIGIERHGSALLVRPPSRLTLILPSSRPAFPLRA